MSKIITKYLVLLTDGEELELSETGGKKLQEHIKKMKKTEFVDILDGTYQVGEVKRIYPIKRNML